MGETKSRHGKSITFDMPLPENVQWQVDRENALTRLDVLSTVELVGELRRRGVNVIVSDIEVTRAEGTRLILLAFGVKFDHLFYRTKGIVGHAKICWINLMHRAFRETYTAIAQELDMHHSTVAYHVENFDKLPIAAQKKYKLVVDELKRLAQLRQKAEKEEKS